MPKNILSIPVVRCKVCVHVYLIVSSQKCYEGVRPLCESENGGSQ